MGLHVPEIAHVDEAQSMVASAKYGPLGHRGLGGVRASQWGLKGPMPEYTVAANRETMVIAHIEHIDAANNLDQLLEVDGIDVYYVGPVDLSNSLGSRTGERPESRCLC
jgi:2-keto-3-deoxy-L-rhamnonate aldolase RhmA